MIRSVERVCAAEDQPGEFRMIHKGDLKIDDGPTGYQREALSPEKIDAIRRDFYYAAFAALVVALRPDGTFWILDGGHRWRASLGLDSITHLPCLVFKVASISHEAGVFRKINELRN